MRYQIAMNSVEFFAFHGLYPEEKQVGGKFIVDLLVEQEVDDKASLKRLVEVMNYEQLFPIVEKEMQHPRELIEAVAKCILDNIGSKVHHVQFAEIKITKLNPGGIFKSGSASVLLSKHFN